MSCITPTPAPIADVPLTSSYLIVMVPELVISDEAYPVHVNRPGGGKDYLCYLCSFQHTNYDCMLTHIQKTPQHHYWISWLWPGFPKCSLLVQAQEEGTSDMHHGFSRGTVIQIPCINTVQI